MGKEISHLVIRYLQISIMWVNARKGKNLHEKGVSCNGLSWPRVLVELEGIQLIYKRELIEIDKINYNGIE